MGGYREGDMPRTGLSAPFAYHPAHLCKSCLKKKEMGTSQFHLPRTVLIDLRADISSYEYGNFSFGESAMRQENTLSSTSGRGAGHRDFGPVRQASDTGSQAVRERNVSPWTIRHRSL